MAAIDLKIFIMDYLEMWRAMQENYTNHAGK